MQSIYHNCILWLKMGILWGSSGWWKSYCCKAISSNLKNVIYNHITHLYHIHFTALSWKVAMVFNKHTCPGPGWFHACFAFFWAFSLQTLLAAIWSCMPLSSPFPINVSDTNQDSEIALGADVFLCHFIPLQVLQEETSIPGSDLNLIYLSSRTVGYKPVLKVTMTQSSIPFNLMKVRYVIYIYISFKFPQSHCDMILHISTEWQPWTASVN